MNRLSSLILVLAGGAMGGATTIPGPSILLPESATVVTVAGNGEAGIDDGQGEMAQFNWPTGVAIAPDWTLSIADYANHLIRTISPDGVVATRAGNGMPGSVNGHGTAAQLKGPDGLVISPSGDLYIAEADNYQIRKITRDGAVTTVAGNGRRGDRDGPAREAQFGYPTGIAIDGRGVLYIADRGAHKIKMITPDGIVSTLAGSGVPGYTDGMGRAAQFHDPMTVAIDRDGRLFVADSGNHAIRMVAPTGRVTTVAGTPQSGFADGPRDAARFNWPTGLALDETGNLYVADSNNARIRKITPDGIVTTIAGNGRAGFHDGPGLTAQFNFPTGVGVDRKGNLYVADSANHRIRRISAGLLFFTACCRQEPHMPTSPPEARFAWQGSSILY
jgi:serine/threonine-protein kinase